MDAFFGKHFETQPEEGGDEPSCQYTTVSHGERGSEGRGETRGVDLNPL